MIQHRFPNTNGKLKITEPNHKAVGVPAIWHSLRHLGKYMDVPEAIKSSLKMNQKGGFDCAGCAWPDPDDDRSSIGEYCENGIKALAEEATNKKADPSFFSSHSIEELSSWTEFELGKSGRITHPMVLKEGGTHYEVISWNDAFELIGKQLRTIEPDEAIFYTSGRTSNEAAFLYGTFVRAYGTNNLPDCSNMCHETSGHALTETLGIGKGSVTLDDIHNADLLMVIGQNPGTNHPRMMSAMEKCKENGGKIIAVNPLKEAGLIHYTNPQRPKKILLGGIDLADLYLQVQINGDVALLKAIMVLLLEAEKSGKTIFDHEFINVHTQGYEALIQDLEQADFVKCVQDSGVSEAEIRHAAEMIIAEKNMIICWAMGITQHANGVENIREIVNLLLLRGSIGKPNAGVCPVRGHSNVQGDRTMGIWEKMGEEWLNRLGKAFDFDVPKEEGYATVPAIKAMTEGKARFFMGMGGNFISAVPDTDYCARGLQQCEMTVQVSTKPNRSHLIHGKTALILPVLGRSEIDVQQSGYQFVSVENSMGIVHSSKGVLPPKSAHLKSEVAVICGLANETLKGRIGENIQWLDMMADYDLIRDKIEDVIPGFDNYNTRIRIGKGFYLPNGIKQRQFNTDTGKAHFTVNPLPSLSLKENQFRLSTVRSHDQYNTTLYGLDDRYRGVKNGRNIIFMNTGDMQRLNLKSGESVNVHSFFNEEKRSIFDFKIVPYDLPKQCLTAYFPEANPLVAIDHANKHTHTPVSKNIIVEVEKLG